MYTCEVCEDTGMVDCLECEGTGMLDDGAEECPHCDGGLIECDCQTEEE